MQLNVTTDYAIRIILYLALRKEDYYFQRNSRGHEHTSELCLENNS